MTDQHWEKLLEHLLKETDGKEYSVFLLASPEKLGIGPKDVPEIADRLKKDGRMGFRVPIFGDTPMDPVDIVFYRMPGKSEPGKKV